MFVMVACDIISRYLPRDRRRRFLHGLLSKECNVIKIPGQCEESEKPASKKDVLSRLFRIMRWLPSSFTDHNLHCCGREVGFFV